MLMISLWSGNIMDNYRQSNSKQACRKILSITALLIIVSGCRSGLDVSMLRGAEKSRFEVAEDETEKKGMFKKMGNSISKIAPVSFMKKSDSSAAPLPTEEGYQELQQAKALAQSGEYKKAEKEFKRIAKRYPDSSIAEEAMFYRSESFYARKRYSYAQDSYTELMKNYPSTRHMRTATRRLFEISQTWLGFKEVATSSDIQPVNFEDISSTKPITYTEPSPKGITRTIPIFPNLTDRSRPIFDTEGRALEALKSIWMNDPTGPLADDALMLSATYYLRKKDYFNADHFLTILREEYPKSPHLENAFLLGSHVKLMAYQGPEYESKSLEDSKMLSESTLRIFPNTEIKERKLDEIRKIEHAHAEQQWQWVKYYQKKKRPESVAVYCNLILEEYPHSEFATQAQQILNTLETRQLAQNTEEKKSRLQIFRRKKKDEEPDFEDDIESLKEEDSPTRLKQFVPKLFKRNEGDEVKELKEPDFMDESEMDMEDIPNYDDPQFIDDEESMLTDDLNESGPDFVEEIKPGRLELDPEEETDIINLDEPDFIE